MFIARNKSPETPLINFFLPLINFKVSDFIYSSKFMNNSIFRLTDLSWKIDKERVFANAIWIF